MKIICRRFHIKTHFAFWDMHTWNTWKDFQINISVPLTPNFRDTYRRLLHYVPHTSSCLTCLRAFAPYVLYLRALSTRLAHLSQAPYAPYLCTFKSFWDGFIVLQKRSIFQRLLKALQTVLFLCGSTNSRDTFKRGDLLSIFKTWNQFHVFVFFFSPLQSWSNKFLSLK